MPLLITQMLLIAKERGLEDGTRIDAVEVLAIICEEAPAMARKFPMLAQQFVPVLDVIERICLRGWMCGYKDYSGAYEHTSLHGAGEWRERAQEEGYWPVPSTRSAFEEAEARF